MKLNHNKPFFTVHGGDTRASFEQDGKLFDSNGDEVVEAVDTETTTETGTDTKPSAQAAIGKGRGKGKQPAKKETPAAPATNAASEVDQQLAAQGA